MCRLFMKSIYSKDFRNSFVSLVRWRKSKLTYFDPLNKKKNPNGEKSKFFPRMLILIAQKKRLGALNATQKNRSLPSTVTEKITKNHQNVQKWTFFGKFAFWRLFLISSVMVLSKGLWFFALRSVHQDSSFELSKSTFGKKIQIFHPKEGPFGSWGVKISYFGFTSSYQGNETISEILRVNALQKKSAQHSSTYLVYVCHSTMKAIFLVLIFRFRFS